MVRAQIRSLLQTEAGAAGIELQSDVLDKLEAHYQLLVRWNRAVRLVGDPDPATVVRRHILESLMLLPFIHEPRGSLLDIGSGNGYPAIPLKCAMPDLRLAMLEPTMRKSLFLGTIIRELGLRDATVMRDRVDKPADLARLGRWDCITMRAVAAISAVLAGSAAALRPHGRLVFMVGESGRAEVLRRLPSDLEIQADHRLPSTHGSYIVVAGIRSSAPSETVH